MGATEDAASRRPAPHRDMAAHPEASSGIPLVDVKAQYAPLIPELQERFAAVLESGRFILGPEVEAFEREAAAFLGVPHAIGVANGTDALVLSLEALRIGPGDEVLCPAFTFYATAEAVARTGATPVFADIDPTTLNLDPEDVAARITPRTRAIVAVHLFGRPAPLPELAALGVPIVEDAAQAFGADGIAQTGICSTFSFYPTKNLFALAGVGLGLGSNYETFHHGFRYADYVIAAAILALAAYLLVRKRRSSRLSDRASDPTR